MKNLFTFIAIMLAMAAGAANANAQALDGSYTVTQGSTVTVEIGAAYQTTLNRATNITYTWTAANSSIAIQSKTSKTCTIKGVTPTDKVRLNYQCSYRYDGYSRSMNFYYDITVKSNTVQVTRVAMSPEKAEMEIGETLQLSATAYPTNATNRALNWTTENYSVASVDNNGLVTARGEGRVWIWARAIDGSGSGSHCVIDVKAPQKVESIELDKEALSLNIGDMYSLEATVFPDNAYNKSVEWMSTDNDVATVDEGNITAVGEGECDIVCTSADGSGVSAVCHVTVNAAPRCWLTVKVPNGSYAVDVTGLDKVTLKITPEDGYKVHSVTLNGEKIPDAENPSIITLGKLDDDALLNAVFVDDDEFTTDIDGVASDDNDVHVSVCDHRVNVECDAEYTIYVYDLNGRLIMSTSQHAFDLTGPGVYIIRVGSRSYKVAV